MSLLLLVLLGVATLVSPARAQNSAHPDAQPVLPENPYLSQRNPWRWDIKAQLFLSAANVLGSHTEPRGRVFDDIISTNWDTENIELVYPVVREGSFYWSPNKDVDVSVRLDDLDVGEIRRRDWTTRYRTKPPVDIQDAHIERKYIEGTYSEYTYWNSTGIEGRYRQMHLIHTSHIVVADTVFDDKLARQLPWPQAWGQVARAYLTPIVDSTGAPVAEDADETIRTLLDFWIDDNDPRSTNELDLVKYLTGKVVEYVTIRGQSTEFPLRTTGGGRPALAVSSNAYGGFIVRPADEVARDPSGSKHDLATLLTAVLRSAGVPARTVICIDQEIEDPLLNVVSMVEFAMYDPQRELTFWVPIDVDRVRLTGGRSSQFARAWLYFGTHDRLHNYIPVAYYFHPQASYKAYNLPDLYGIRRLSPDTRPMPEYMIQSLLIDPMVSPATANPPMREPENPE